MDLSTFCPQIGVNAKIDCPQKCLTILFEKNIITNFVTPKELKTSDNSIWPNMDLSTFCAQVFIYTSSHLEEVDAIKALTAQNRDPWKCQRKRCA